MTEVIAWALLHSLWQGAVLAAVLAAARPVLRHLRTPVRYGVASLALLLMLLLPCGTALRLIPLQPTRVEVRTAHFGMESLSQRLGTPEGVRREALRLEEAVQPGSSWLVLLWLSGVMIMSLRLAGGVHATNQLLRLGVEGPTERCHQLLDQLVKRLKITRRVGLVFSHRVHVPSVIGWLKPVILLPAAIALQLSPEQLEAVLVHELAHIRRYDYLVNFVQSCVDTLLFYHPAVWWVSGVVRQERENLSDDTVIEICGDRVAYARTLILLERLRPAPGTSLAIAATGGDLFSRVKRIAEPVQKMRLTDLLPVLLILATLLGSAATFRLRAQDQESGSRDALQRIISSLEGQDWKLTKAIDSDLRLLRQGPLEAVTDNLRHPNRQVRERTAWVLGQLGEPSTVQALSDLLEDVSPRVAHTAAWALGRIGDRAAAPRLIQALRSSSSDARAGAAWALGSIRVPEAVAPLIGALSEPESDIRSAAAWALGRIGDESARTPLLTASRDLDPDVRAKATEALSRMLAR